MKVMILTAGLGTRLRPHTYSKPKPLVSVAGKPVLAHIIDDLLDIQIDELICVTGYLGDQIESYVRGRYTMPLRFLVQKEMRGQADAIYLANDVEGPMLVVFGDGLVGIDKDRLNTHPSEGIIYCQEVEDPSRFGVAVIDPDQRITRLVEKPSTPVSNLAVVGFYYVPEARRLMDAITYMMEHNIQTKGEFYLADALQIMLERGEVFRAETVSMWRDCGTIDALLDTNRYLLEHGHSRDEAVVNAVIVPPVYIGPGAKVENAVLGPHVSLGAGAVVRNAIISDSIVNAGAQITGAILTGSVIGDRAVVTGAGQELNVGDASSTRIR
jgi:glucose-1-phosphate thymidylyltransferase